MTSSEFIYGRNPVEEARRGRRRVLRVWESPETPETKLVDLCGSADHQGIVAEVEPFPYVDGSELLQTDDALVVVLDQIQDPRNLGAICRSAEAAGATGVVIPDRRAASITAAAAKASAGAVEHLKVARVRNISDWIAEAKDSGFWVWGADGNSDQAPWQVDLTGRTALVLGTEEKGLRPRVAESCDGLIAIPQSGKVDSLNVSVAASILIFEAIRQRS